LEVRPRAPGQRVQDAQKQRAGRAPINQTVANFAVEPSRRLRPRAPGHHLRDVQIRSAGRALFHRSNQP
jgi:hypothetical protein